jgi:hypothetical protein
LAVKSIIDVEVNDESFKKFVESFRDYQGLLKKQPTDWSKVNSGIQSAAASLEKIVASFQGLVDATKERQKIGENITVQTRAQTTHVERQAQVWKNLGRTIKDAAGQVVSMTRSLLSWGTLTGVLSGLLGAGGLFGISRLAQSAAGYRRSAMGIGTTVGQQRAFQLNYGRVVNTENVLGGVSESLTDASKRGYLYRGGLREEDIRGKDTGQVSAMLMDSLKKLADATDTRLLGNVHESRGLSQFISAEDFRRLKETPASEMASYRKQYEADTKTLDLTKQQQKVWSDLEKQLKLAGEQIETTFVKKLASWAPQLTSISDSFTSMVNTMLNSKVLEGWIKDVERGLKTLAEYMKTDQFKKDVDAFMVKVGEFADGVGRMIGAIGRFVDWALGKLPTEKKEQFGPPRPEEAPRKPMTEEDKRRRAAEIPQIGSPRMLRELFPFLQLHKVDPSQHREPGTEAPDIQPNPDNFISKLWQGFGSWLKSSGSAAMGTNPGSLMAPINANDNFRNLVTLARAGQIVGGQGQPNQSGQPGLPQPGIVRQASYTPPGQGGGNLANNEEITRQFFSDNGFGPAALAGLMANIKAESSFDPSRVNQVGGDAGLMQWRGPRAKEYERQFGHRVQEGSLQEQLKYALWEMTQGPYAQKGAMLRAMRDPYQAGKFVSEKIESPLDPTGNVARQRGEEAQRRYNRYNANGIAINIYNNTGGAAAVKVASMPA